MPGIIYFVALLQFLILTPVNGQVSSSGPCPNIPMKPGFDFPKYQGLWYYVEKYLILGEMSFKCMALKYFDYDNKTGDFHANVTTLDRINDRLTILNGTGQTITENGSYYLQVSNSHPLLPQLTVALKFVVVDTDYENYSIEYSCKGLTNVKKEQLWIYSKRPERYSEVKEKVYEILGKAGIGVKKLIEMDRTNCPIFS